MFVRREYLDQKMGNKKLRQIMTVLSAYKERTTPHTKKEKKAKNE